MKTKNPFGPILPPGSALGRIAAQHRSHVRVMVFVGVAAGVLGLAVLLIGGCVHARHIEESSANPRHLVPATITTNYVHARLPVMTTNNSPGRAPMATTPPSATLASSSASPMSAPVLATQPITAKNYSVVKGDTFAKIAKANSVSVSALVKANPGIEPTKLKIGQVLHIPVGGQKQTLPSSSATHAPAKAKQ